MFCYLTHLGSTALCQISRRGHGMADGGEATRLALGMTGFRVGACACLQHPWRSQQPRLPSVLSVSITTSPAWNRTQDNNFGQ